MTFLGRNIFHSSFPFFLGYPLCLSFIRLPFPVFFIFYHASKNIFSVYFNIYFSFSLFYCVPTDSPRKLFSSLCLPPTVPLSVFSVTTGWSGQVWSLQPPLFITNIQHLLGEVLFWVLFVVCLRQGCLCFSLYRPLLSSIPSDWFYNLFHLWPFSTKVYNSLIYRV